MDPGVGCEGKGTFPCWPRGQRWGIELVLLRHGGLGHCSASAEPRPCCNLLWGLFAVGQRLAEGRPALPEQGSELS